MAFLFYDINPRLKFPKQEYYLKTLVKDGASISANATIVCGITIGRHAFIGSDSIVTEDIPTMVWFIAYPPKSKVVFANAAQN